MSIISVFFRLQPFTTAAGDMGPLSTFLQGKYFCNFLIGIPMMDSTHLHAAVFFIYFSLCMSLKLYIFAVFLAAICLVS